MKNIVVNTVNIDKNKINIDYSVSDELEKYFNLKEQFFVEYEEDMSCVPKAIAVIPFIVNILPIIWLTDAVLEVYEKQGIRNGSPTNTMRGEAFENELCKAYPECRLVVTKETMTVEGMIKIVYSLLKDKLNIVRLTFTSGVNAATETYEVNDTKDRCPLCGVLLDENGVCPKCGYRK